VRPDDAQYYVLGFWRLRCGIRFDPRLRLCDAAERWLGLLGKGIQRKKRGK